MPQHSPSVIGIGKFLAVANTGSVGTPVAISEIPPYAIGIRIYMPASSSISGVFATSPADAAIQASTAVNIYTYSNSIHGPILDENIGTGLNFYETSVTGSVTARWM